MGFSRRICGALVAVTVILGAVRAEGAEYTLTTIAEWSLPPVGPLFFTAPAIDSAGRVVFCGSIGGVEGIYSGSGGAVQPVLTAGPTYAQFSRRPVVNDAGTIALTATRNDGAREVLTWQGGQVKTIATTGGQVTDFVEGRVGLNAGGDVAFTAVGANGDTTVMRTSQGVALPVANNRTAGYDRFGAPTLADDGTAVFWGQRPAPLPSLYDQPILAAKSAITLKRIGGGVVDALDSDWGRYPAVNAGGQVLFLLQNGRIFVGDVGGGGGAREAGPGFQGVMNDRGDIVGTGGGYIYRLDRPTPDVFLDLTSNPYGSPMAGLYLSPDGLNDAGQLAIGLGLADGRTLILRADPVPEPGGGALVLAAVWASGLWRRASRTRGRPRSGRAGH